MTTQHLGLPLPGAWETLVLLALSTAAAAALLFCADAARRRRSPLPGNAARPWLAHAAGCALLGLALVQYAGWTPEFSCVLPHRYASLNDLVVAREKRCQGIGSLLLGAAKRWARDRRLEYLELNVLAQNSKAIELYESHDFVEATRTMRCML